MVVWNKNLCDSAAANSAFGGAQKHWVGNDQTGDPDSVKPNDRPKRSKHATDLAMKKR